MRFLLSIQLQILQDPVSNHLLLHEILDHRINQVVFVFIQDAVWIYMEVEVNSQPALYYASQTYMYYNHKGKLL